MKALYLNQDKAEKLHVGARGPSRHLLNFVKQVLIFQNIKTFPELAFDPPNSPMDLFFFYSHVLSTMDFFRSNCKISESDRAAAIKRLIQIPAAQRILSSSDSLRCWDVFVIFDSLMEKDISPRREKFDILWIYEVLVRALPNDKVLDDILSRPEDFENVPKDELEWG